MSSATVPVTREELEREVQRLRMENDTFKQLIGLEIDAKLDDVEDGHTECEDEDHKVGEEVDIAVELSQCAYEASQLYGRMKKCSGQVITGLRKDFVYAFRALREVIDPERMEDFLSLIEDWLELERRVWTLEEQMKTK